MCDEDGGADHGDQYPGKRLLRLSSMISARVPPPTSSAVGLVLPASRA
jgi:hypothetical protein